MNKKGMSKALIIVILIAIALAAPLLLNSDYWVSVLILVLINILLVASLRTIWLLGNISLGHVGFSLIGAYSSALLVMSLGFPFWVAMVLGGLLAGTIALVLGYPFLRVRGIYFALLTLLTAETLRLIAWYWRSLTGGYRGLTNIPSPNPIAIPVIGTINFDVTNSYYYLAFIVVLLSLLILYAFENSDLGFKWKAIRDADGLAKSVGINTMWYKILNFAIACFFAGIAGALFAHYQHGLSPDITSRFGVIMSIYLLAYMVVGGQAKFFGSIIGVLFITIVSELARPLREFQPMLIGALAILIVLFMPEGIISLPSRLKPCYRKFLRQMRWDKVS